MQAGLEGYTSWLHGDRNALEQTVVAYNRKLICYVGSMFCVWDEAEDVAAETFLRLLCKKPRFSSEEQLGAWLYKTARNYACDLLRKKKRICEETETGTDETGPALPEELVCEEQKRQLHACMDQLKGEYREVLLLLYFSDLSYAQAASVMKKSEAQIRNLAYRARQSLKDKLERIGFTNEK